MDKKVKIYTTPTCPYCRRLKAYLDEKGVVYENIDVSANPEAAKKVVELSGQMAVPMLEIDGGIVAGFDKERIDVLLEL